MAKFVFLTPDNMYAIQYLLAEGLIDGSPDADLIFDLAQAEAEDDRPAAETMFMKQGSRRHAKKRASEEAWRRRTGEAMRDIGLTDDAGFHGKEASRYRHGYYSPYAHDWTYEKTARHGQRFADKRALDHDMADYEDYLRDKPYLDEAEDAEFTDSLNRFARDVDPYGYDDYHSDMEHGFFEVIRLLGSDQPGSIRRFLNEVIEDGRNKEFSKEAKDLLDRLDRLFPGMKNCDMIRGIKREGES